MRAESLRNSPGLPRRVRTTGWRAGGFQSYVRIRGEFLAAGNRRSHLEGFIAATAIPNHSRNTQGNIRAGDAVKAHRRVERCNAKILQ